MPARHPLCAAHLPPLRFNLAVVSDTCAEALEPTEACHQTATPQRGQRIRRPENYNSQALSLPQTRKAATFAPKAWKAQTLDLERWFRLPKGHERRIHGRRHAGVRLVQEGATLMPALDAHKDREEPLAAEELLGYKDAKLPSQEQEALHRRAVMRRARSKRQRPILLAELERRYLDAP